MARTVWRGSRYEFRKGTPANAQLLTSLRSQQLAARLDHEIHFLTDGSAPVVQLCALYTRVSPGERIVQDQILEMRAVRLLGLGQVQRQASIAPVYLRRLDETLDAIPQCPIRRPPSIHTPSTALPFQHDVTPSSPRPCWRRQPMSRGERRFRAKLTRKLDDDIGG